ncbi:MAG: EAL domain-containing protein [Christensenellales bacterium]
MIKLKHKNIFYIIGIILIAISMTIVIVMPSELGKFIYKTEKERIFNDVKGLSDSNEIAIETYFSELISEINTLSALLYDVAGGNIFNNSETTVKEVGSDKEITVKNVKVISEVENVIESYSREKDLNYIQIANVEGNCYLNDYVSDGTSYGARILNISFLSEFQKSLNGENCIFSTAKSAITGEESFVVFAPIKSAETVVGVIFIGYVIEKINKLLIKLMSDNYANYALINKRGDEVSVVTTDSGITDEELALLPDIGDAITEVSLSGGDYYAVTRNIEGFSDEIAQNWVLVTLVENAKIEAYAHKYIDFSKKVMIMVSVFMAVIVVVIALLISYLKHEKHKEIQKSKIVFELLKRYTFEYDLKNDVVYCSEITKNLLGLDSTEYKMDKLVELNYLSADDIDNITTIFNSLADNEIFEYEFYCERLKKYFKITANFIFETSKEKDCFIGIVEDVTAGHIEREELKDKAQTDGMTKLYNRETFSYKVSELKVEANTVDALMLIDIDNFKNINDSFGHMTGDRVLMAVADALKSLNSICPFVKAVSRFGGDEFCVYLAGLKMDNEVSVLARRIIKTITQSTVEKGVETSISIGVALRPKDGDTFDELYQCADNALYESKKKKGASFTVYDSIDIRTLILDDEEYAASEKKCLPSKVKEILIAAIVNDEFEVYVQPYKYCKKNDLGGEVLTRWNSPTFGLVMPNVFIPLLEKNSLMKEFDLYVLKKAFKRSAELESYGKVCLSINQAVSTFVSHDYIKTVLSLKETAKENISFTIEITERGECKSFRTLSKTIKALEDNGIRVALDDFGTANSSLAVLNELKVSELKISRNFIGFSSSGGEASKTIISTITVLAKTLGISVVAEGVETKQQAEFLECIGCDVLQGFYIAVPITFDAFKEYLRLNI